MFLVDSYRPDSLAFQQQYTASEFNFLINTIKGKEELIATSMAQFVTTVKSVTAKWNEQLAEAYPQQTKALVCALHSPSPCIIEHEAMRKAYFRLYVCCLYPKVSKALSFFERTLRLMQSSRFVIKSDEKGYLLAATSSKMAIACQRYLKPAEQKLISDIRSHLGKQTDTLFTEKRKEIYLLALEIFSDKAFDEGLFSMISPFNAIVQGNSQLSDSIIFREWEPIPDDWETGIEDWEIVEDPTKCTSTLCIDEEEEAHQDLTADLTAAAIFSSGIITDNLTQSMHGEDISSQPFISAFWSQYGSEILSQGAEGLIQKLKEPALQKGFVDLYFSYIGENSESQSPLVKMLMSLCRESTDQVLPLFMNTFLKKVISELQDDFLSEGFCKLTQEAMISLCSGKSQQTMADKISLFGTALEGLQNYLCDLNTSLARIYPSGPPYLNIETEEKLLITEMQSCLHARGLPAFENSEAISKQIHQLLQEHLTNALCLDAAPTIQQKLGVFAGSLYLTHTIDRLISSESIYIFLDLYLAGSLSSPQATLLSNHFPKFDSLDPQFTENLAVGFYKMFFEICKLADAPQFLQSIFKALASDIKDKVLAAAKHTHENIYDLINESSDGFLITPLLMLNQILHNHKTFENGQKTLDQSLMTHSQMFNQVRQRVEEKMKSKPQELISGLIQQQLSPSMRLAIQLFPIDELCKKLADRLYRLSQQETLLKMSLCYLLPKK